jgi:hypothetical protein
MVQRHGSQDPINLPQTKTSHRGRVSTALICTLVLIDTPSAWIALVFLHCRQWQHLTGCVDASTMKFLGVADWYWDTLRKNTIGLTSAHLVRCHSAMEMAARCCRRAFPSHHRFHSGVASRSRACTQGHSRDLEALTVKIGHGHGGVCQNVLDFE